MSSNRKISNKVLTTFLLVGVFVFPIYSFAADPPSTPGAVDQPGRSASVVDQPSSKIVPLQNPLKVDSIGGLVQSFVEIFSYIVILGAVLALIWVGLQFILARGNPERMNELKSWLSWIVIGVAVVIGARLIIQVVINTLSTSGAVDQRTIQSVQKAVNNN